MKDEPVFVANLKTQRTNNALMNSMAMQLEVSFENFEGDMVRGVPVRIEYIPNSNACLKVTFDDGRVAYLN